MSEEHPLKRDSLYLYAEDFLVEGEWKQFVLTIKGLHAPNTVKGGDGRAIPQPLIGFEETPKLFGLNKTNLRLLHMACGTIEGRNLIGARITLYPAVGSAFGQKDVPWLRIRVPQGRPVPYGVRKQLGQDLTGTRVTVNRKPKGETEVIPIPEGDADGEAEIY